MLESEAEIAILKEEEIHLVSLSLRHYCPSNQCRLNAPTFNEMNMIFVNEDCESSFKREMQIYPKHPLEPSQKFRNLCILTI